MSQTKHSFVVRGKYIFFIYVTTLAYIICMVNKSFMFNLSGFVIVVFGGLHGLKTEARTRPVPEIVWPNPTRPERHS